MILSGDAPAEIEQKILDQIPGLHADIVKLGITAAARPAARVGCKC